MTNKKFSKYYLCSCIGFLAASYYPLSMGIRVLMDMLMEGHVMKENYPKYVIPYTPISIAILFGIVFMPLLIRIFKKNALLTASVLSSFAFFALEQLLEQKVVVTSTETVTKLEDWQMYMCAIVPDGLGETVTTYRTETAVDILLGNYNPAFKVHFYLISIVLIVSILNCFYGFGELILTDGKKRKKVLALQAFCSMAFLGLCILACFTAFWRDGNILVSPLSAMLMAIFFVLFGVTAGVFAGSFLQGKRKLVSVCIPAMAASLMTFFMYIGEMILLNGNLYRFGTGFLFNGMSWIIFAPIDILIIAISGCLTSWVLAFVECPYYLEKE